MKTIVGVVILTVLATAFYAYVAHMVPQKVTYPPEEVEISADMTTEEMVKVGEEIVGGKGTCLSCHTIGSHDDALRFPDLGGVGARAGNRKPGMDDIEYLAESLYDPNAYIVEGFNPGMVAVSKPPISLSDQEILTVIAYLQSLGGTPTVTMDTKLKWQGTSPATTPAPSGGTAVASTGQTGKELMTTYACLTCHNVDSPDKLVGPSLQDVGARMSAAEIYESIIDPDATVAEGFAPGLMVATLNGLQFYDKASATDIKSIVHYLSTLKGSE